jgi:hypothetical protein
MRLIANSEALRSSIPETERRWICLKRGLFIRKGKVQVDFYSDKQDFLESRVLETDDIILLVQGGHGFKVIEELEMFEVKQDLYAGDEDKIMFSKS